jgi:hypothetical protein
LQKRLTPTEPPTIPHVLPLPEDEPLDEALLATALALALVMVLVDPSRLTEIDVMVTMTAEAARRKRVQPEKFSEQAPRNLPFEDEAGAVDEEEGVTAAAGGVVVVAVVFVLGVVAAAGAVRERARSASALGGLGPARRREMQGGRRRECREDWRYATCRLVHLVHRPEIVSSLHEGREELQAPARPLAPPRRRWSPSTAGQPSASNLDVYHSTEWTSFKAVTGIASHLTHQSSRLSWALS